MIPKTVLEPLIGKPIAITFISSGREFTWFGVITMVTDTTAIIENPDHGTSAVALEELVSFRLRGGRL
jgi:hypothetical protein